MTRSVTHYVRIRSCRQHKELISTMSLDSPLHFPSFPSYFCSCVISWVSISSEITLVWNPHHLNQLPSPVSLFLQVSAGSLACNLLVLKWKHKVRVTYISIKGYARVVVTNKLYMLYGSSTTGILHSNTNIYHHHTTSGRKGKIPSESLANSLFNVQGINVRLMWIYWTL